MFDQGLLTHLNTGLPSIVPFAAFVFDLRRESPEWTETEQSITSACFSYFLGHPRGCGGEVVQALLAIIQRRADHLQFTWE